MESIDKNKSYRAELSSPSQTKKLPYEAPSVISEEVFETMALACGKQVGDPNPACDIGFFRS